MQIYIDTGASYLFTFNSVSQQGLSLNCKVCCGLHGQVRGKAMVNPFFDP